MFYKPRAGLNALHGVTWAIRLRRPLFRSGGSRENVASRGLDDTLPCPWFADSSLRSECRLSTYCELGRYKRCGSIPQAKNPAMWLDFSASGIRDSNSRPSAWEADALPTELIPQCCDPHRIQTCNLLIRSQMLYSVELGDQSFYSSAASFFTALNLRSLILAFLPDRLRR